jgi:hypothetical protein
MAKTKIDTSLPRLVGAVTFTTKGEEINGRTFIDEKDIVLH